MPNFYKYKRKNKYPITLEERFVKTMMYNLTTMLILLTLPLSSNPKGGYIRPDSSGDFILNNSLHPCHPALSGWWFPLGPLDARVHFYFSSKNNTKGGFMPATRTTLSRLQLEADVMVKELVRHLTPTKPNFSYVRKIEPARVKVYSEHLCFILKQIEHLRGAQ